MKRNPRRISWTAAYRHAHKKGLVAEKAKKRTRKTFKAERAIVGMNLDAIRAKRNQDKGERQAQRELALRYNLRSFVTACIFFFFDCGDMILMNFECREIKERKAADAAKKKANKKANADVKSHARVQKQRGKAGGKGR